MQVRTLATEVASALSRKTKAKRKRVSWMVGPARKRDPQPLCTGWQNAQSSALQGPPHKWPAAAESGDRWLLGALERQGALAKKTPVELQQEEHEQNSEPWKEV